jgi:hypothetical protein
MTEAEWLHCREPDEMLSHLRHRKPPIRPTERKLRLYGCACCRRIWPKLMNPLDRQIVEGVERFVDGSATKAEFAAILAAAEQDYRREIAQRGDPRDWLDSGRVAVSYLTEWKTERNSTEFLMTWLHRYCSASVPRRNTRGEKRQQCILLRDIVGNPFRYARISTTCRTATVVTLAQAIYEDRTFDRLPILADALEDAGCTNAEVLNHCRQEGVHVRGCWVVDLLLNKE